MGSTTIGRAIEITESVLEDTDNSEYKFRLRTVLQLLEIIEDRHEAATSILADCEMDEQTRSNLRELGYLE